MFDIALNKAASKSEWVSWLVKDTENAARSTLGFLHMCFGNIPASKHRRIFDKLAGARSEVEATIHELVVHELLRRLELSPEFEPSVTGLTPDISFEIEGKRFLGDVYLTHSPSKTLRDFADGTGEAWDTSKPDESRANKIANELAKKAVKYRPTALPLVAFVFLGDHRILSASDVERSLFGMTAYEVSLEEQFPNSVLRDRVPVGGLLLPDEDGNYRHQNLSAVISCDWFDTLNRQDPGKRLHCLVLHNWIGEALPIEAFRLFPQIIWNQSEPSVWKPEQTISANTVANFTLDGGIECREYTPNMAW
ncbi:MAG: hypothetical protein L0229_08335 [Blastocatellia bacterium]|nr:hypothetical protein [Blastocatellia bacterium]